MDVDVLEREVARRRPKLVYTIPSFNNPTGQTLSHERRERLVRLSVEHDFLVVADEVYQLLHYAKPPPPALGTWVDRGNVLSLGSFSKIVAPGMRLGWIQTDAARIRHLLASGAIISGGCFNHFGSHVVRQMLEDGSLAELIAELRRAYGARVAAMDEALHRAPRRHRDLAETRRRLFLLADAAARSGYRAPARGRALSRGRLPAGVEVLGHGRHA